MPRAKKRTPELGERIVTVALEMLAEDGAAALTVRSLADRAGTSPPALYELFGDKGGVVRRLYGEGFRQLARELSTQAETEDPLSDLWTLASAYRRFIRTNRELADVMFFRPFSGFDPGPDEVGAAAGPVRAMIQSRVRRGINARRLLGDEADIASVLEALLQGMAFAEVAGRLGTSTESVERRWRLAVGAALNGFGARTPR